MDPQLFAFLNKLNDRFDKLEKKFEMLEANANISPVEKKKEFKFFKIKLSYDQGLRSVSEKDIQTDINIIKRVMITDVSEPSVRFVGRGLFQYWKDYRWIDDPNGSYILKVLLQCLSSFYRASINLIKEKNSKDFIGTMRYVDTMTSSSYRSKFLNELKDILKI